MNQLSRCLPIAALTVLTGWAQDNVVLMWNTQALATIRATNTSPPIASRALAMLHTAMYDAWAAYDPNAQGTRLGSALRRPATEATPQNINQALSHAAYRVLADQFPTQSVNFTTLMARFGYDPSNATTEPTQPAGVGNAAAQALLEFRHGDGSNQMGDLRVGAYADYTGYQPVNTSTQLTDPNRWQPLPQGASVQRWLLPQWGLVKPFALASGSEFRLGPPPQYGTALGDGRAEDMRRINAELTDQQKMVAEYWADGAGTVTPPGHWNEIAAAVSRRDHHTVDQDVQMFFILNNALMDAGIAVWDTKLKYDYVRPVSMLRNLYRNSLIQAWAGPGHGTQFISGAQWQPYLATPPFAEYPSGHSTFSSAAAEVLRMFTGGDSYGGSVTFEPGSSLVEPGLVPFQAVTLTWATFSDAADEAGWSRRLGGIHFEDADIRGRILGRLVAHKVWEKAQGYLKGQ